MVASCLSDIVVSTLPFCAETVSCMWMWITHPPTPKLYTTPIRESRSTCSCPHATFRMWMLRPIGRNMWLPSTISIVPTRWVSTNIRQIKKFYQYMQYAEFTIFLHDNCKHQSTRFIKVKETTCCSKRMRQLATCIHMIKEGQQN